MLPILKYLSIIAEELNIYATQYTVLLYAHKYIAYLETRHD